MTERLTRRQAISALFGLTGAGLIAASNIDSRLRPFIETLGSPEKGKITPKDLVPFINQVGEFSVPRSPNPIENTPSRVEVNKEYFAKAILQVADFGGKVSPERIYSLLQKRPLSLKMTSEVPPQYLYQGKIVKGAARYLPYWYVGPEITFYKKFVRSYQKGLGNSDSDSLSLQYLNDINVYHEIRHLLQDMENPIKNICNLGFSDIKEGLSLLTFGKGRYNRSAQSFEVDADRVAGLVALSNLKTYTPQNLNWPFGKFLTFS